MTDSHNAEVNNHSISDRVKILLIEDDYLDAQIFQSLLSRVDDIEIRVTHVKRLTEARAVFVSGQYDLIVSDLMLPDSLGLQTISNIKLFAKEIPIVAVTGSKDETMATQAIHSGADDYLVKGSIDAHLLGRVIRYAIDRKIIQLEVQKLAQIDTLTGLLNRHSFEPKLQKSMQRTERKGFKTALLFLDLDFFKSINDDYGHQAGDAVLSSTADRMVRSIREQDYAARFGGDEFVLVLEDVQSEAMATNIANRVLAELKKPVYFEGDNIALTASIGIYIYDGLTAITADEILNRADSAMYRAKKDGRNKVSCFKSEKLLADQAAPSSKCKLIQRHADLRDAFNNDEFILHYQPQINVNTGETVGAEALLRWLHPQNGLIPPLEFIGILESSGQIVSVGLWVIETACKQWVEWIKLGCVPPNSKISVNLSPRQCQQNDFTDTIKGILARVGLPPHLLTLELTEGMLLESSEKNIVLMQSLKEMGLNLSLDDFGTGFSSLSYLTQMPIDSLKIDRSFVKKILQDKTPEVIAASIIGLAQKLNMEVVAEGVEEIEQINLLSALGCKIFQGYYYSKPLETDAFANFSVADALC